LAQAFHIMMTTGSFSLKVLESHTKDGKEYIDEVAVTRDIEEYYW
jgi:hypothetical protein